MISFVLYHRVNQDYISAPVQFLQQLLIVFKVSPDTSSKQVILQLNDERAEFVWTSSQGFLIMKKASWKPLVIKFALLFDLIQNVIMNGLQVSDLLILILK